MDGKITQHHKQVDSVVFVKKIMSVAPSAGWPTYTRDKQTGEGVISITHHPKIIRAAKGGGCGHQHYIR